MFVIAKFKKSKKSLHIYSRYKSYKTSKPAFLVYIKTHYYKKKHYTIAIIRSTTILFIILYPYETRSFYEHYFEIFYNFIKEKFDIIFNNEIGENNNKVVDTTSGGSKNEGYCTNKKILFAVGASVALIFVVYLGYKVYTSNLVTAPVATPVAAPVATPIINL